MAMFQLTVGEKLGYSQSYISEGDSSNTELDDIITGVGKSMHQTAVKRHCFQIAKGILMRSNGQPESDDLLTIFGSGDSTIRNNVSAVASWVYELNPEQNISDSNAVNEFIPRFYKRLEECGINVSE